MSYILRNIDYYPFFCNLQLTKRCNLTCLHCGFSCGKEYGEELTTNELTKLVEQLSELKCERIQLTGGEPLIREDWEEIVDAITGRSIEVTLISNGVLITDKIAKRIKESGISTVGISVDGIEETHNFLRNNSRSFNNCLRAITNLSNHGVSVGVLTTINILNLDELENIRQLLIQHNVSSWRLQIPSLIGRMIDQKKIMPLAEDIEKITKYIVNTRDDDRIVVIPGDSIGYYGLNEKLIRDVGGDLPYFTGCYAGCLSVAIESNGDVKGCLALPHELCEGNIRETSLREIWTRENAFSYNRKFTISMLEGSCKICPFGEICRAGCKSCAYVATNSLHNNPFCDYRINELGDKSWWERGSNLT